MARIVPNNFLGVEPPHDRYDNAAFAILPLPYDATVTYVSGTREGPAAIIRASQFLEWYDEELHTEPYRHGIATLDAHEPDARGPEQAMADIEQLAHRPLADGKFLLSLGGEHSVTGPLVRAVHKRHPTVSVLQIDAHLDLHDAYANSPHSHASVMRRVHELGVPAVAVGIRNTSAEEAAFLREHPKPVYSARHCLHHADWIERVVSDLTDEVYVTIDIDGFDPAYAPGAGTPEPGGLDWYRVIDLLAAVAQHRRIVAADIVEVRPIPPSNVTEFLAARLAYRLMALVSRDWPLEPPAATV